VSHTPGPWRCIGGPFPGVLEIESVRGEYVAADVHGEANANLITAAPDLLAALNELADAFAEVYHGDGWLTHPSYLKACRATAKAEGSAS
jgi:hypothetical protein